VLKGLPALRAFLRGTGDEVSAKRATKALSAFGASTSAVEPSVRLCAVRGRVGAVPHAIHKGGSMSPSWMPLMGEFDTTVEPLVFKGRAIPAPAVGEPQAAAAPELASVGIVLSNEKMLNGQLRATVKFSEVTVHSVCELIVAYDPHTQRQISVGLGGSSAMFSIREWIPSPTPQTSGKWVNHNLTGDRSNLHAGVEYQLQVSIQGSSISLDVNDVQVTAATLPAVPNQAQQVGLFLVSTTAVEVSGFRVSTERAKAFIVMQFSSPYNEVYSHVIKNVCQRDEFKIEAIRADEIYGPGMIIRDVIDQIRKAQVVIADISPDNPNVYFEVGYALALRKPIILLAQRRQPGEALPFDLSAFRVLFYDDSIGGKPKLEEGLVNHLRAIFGQ
jgi:Nucleoside 2-deoxyribosyltransferase